MSESLRVSIVGGSGYAGGELLRLLLDHPGASIAQVTSERSAGQFVQFTHPNLRGRTQLKFCQSAEVEACDVLFLALPHGRAMAQIERFTALAPKVIDLSADFRLSSIEHYQRHYGNEHGAPSFLEQFVYGLPELHRERLRGTDLASGVGCNAAATTLALLPFMGSELVDWSRGVVCEVKVGSSEGGHRSRDASHHPERSGAVRSFAPTGHRHTAEVEQALALFEIETAVHLSATSIEMVRGVLATAHLFARDSVTERDLYRAYRQAVRDEPFVRLVKEKRGLYRYPEPKILAGSNYADIGFAYDPKSGRIVALAAIDNLVKGAAGSAVQAMNLMCGFDEQSALGFPGLHPI